MSTSYAGLAFEQETMASLRRLGWVVRGTPKTGDWGADIIAAAGGDTMVVQCKDYGNPVGVGAIQEIHFARTHYHANRAAVVSRIGYTKSAVSAAQRARVDLFRLQDIRYGCGLDRTSERQKALELPALRRRELRAAKDYFLSVWKQRRASARWRNYDRAMINYSENVRWYSIFKRFGYVALTMSITTLLFSPSYGITVTLLAITAAVAIQFARPPKPPSLDRRGAVIECDICLSLLRVEYGKTGQVRCPTCRTLMGVST